MAQDNIAGTKTVTASDRFMNSCRFLLRGENMMKTKCDEKGRLQLGPELRHRYGEKFYVVEMPEKLVLLPVPDDPVKDLQRLGRPLWGMSLAEIKQAIQEQADKEVKDLCGLFRS